MFVCCVGLFEKGCFRAAGGGGGGGGGEMDGVGIMIHACMPWCTRRVEEGAGGHDHGLVPVLRVRHDVLWFVVGEGVRE